jgi:hypothetical protein
MVPLPSACLPVTGETVSLYRLPAMSRPHAFLITTAAALAAGCAAAAVAFAPMGDRDGSPAAFAFFTAVGAAAGALTVTTAADGLAGRR